MIEFQVGAGNVNQNLNSILGPLNSAEPTPLYIQLASNLRLAMKNQDLTPNEMLPNERALARQLEISRVTVRNALRRLEDEGLLERRQGAGTFVVDASRKHSVIEKDFAQLSSFSEDIINSNGIATSRVLLSEVSGASAQEAFQLGLPEGEDVWRLNRLRLANDIPLAVEFSIVPATALAGSRSFEGSLYEALARQNNRPTRALQRLRAGTFGKDISALLEQPGAVVGLHIQRRGFLPSGIQVEFTNSYYRGDAYEFFSEVSVR